MLEKNTANKGAGGKGVLQRSHISKFLIDLETSYKAKK